MDRRASRNHPSLAVGLIEADRIVLEATGDFGPAATDMIRERFRRLVNAGVRHVIVELGSVTSLSDGARIELAEVGHALATMGGTLQLRDAPATTRAIDGR